MFVIGNIFSCNTAGIFFPFFIQLICESLQIRFRPTIFPKRFKVYENEANPCGELFMHSTINGNVLN